MEQDEEQQRVDASTEETHRRTHPGASAPPEREHHTASDGEILQRFE
jgi:hypothetical protein